jgi:RNA polymerase sigma-70 factor, ECF subfamily
MSPKQMPGLSQKTDEQLLSLVKKGDRDAFDMLFERYKAKVFSFILRYIGDHATAEDIFQNTFVRLYTKAGYYSRESKFSTWLYTIAANLCKDELKKRSIRRHVPIDGDSRGGNGLDLPPAGESIATPTAGPRQQADNNEINASIHNAVDALPDDLRAVVVLHSLHLMKYHEVAKILGIPTGTVQSRMHSALVRLRETMKKLLPDRK